MKKHQQNHKRIFIAVVILIALIFMMLGPKAKASGTEAAFHLVEKNIPTLEILKALLTT